MLVHSLASKYARFVVLVRQMYWTPPFRPLDPPTFQNLMTFFLGNQEILDPPFQKSWTHLYYKVNSYPAHTKSDNSVLFISCSSCYYTARWTVPTFLSTSWMLQSPGPHYTTDRIMYKVRYLLTNYTGCFIQKCVFIVAMVTGLLLIELERL